MFKKTLAFMTAVAAAACMFVSCGDSKKDKDDDDDNDTKISDTYISKSKKASANATASTLYKGVNAALTDFDSKGTTYKGKYILCSDPHKSISLPEGGEMLAQSDFMKYVEDNFMDMTDVEYIIAISDGVCVGTAATTDGGKYVGLYPLDTVSDMNSYGGKVKTYEPDDKISFTEVYDLYKSQTE